MEWSITIKTSPNAVRIQCFECIVPCYRYSVNRDFSVVRENEGIAAQSLASGPRGIAFSFSGIDELIAKARFNKRDMLISKPIRMEQYKASISRNVYK